MLRLSHLSLSPHMVFRIRSMNAAFEKVTNYIYSSETLEMISHRSNYSLTSNYLLHYQKLTGGNFSYLIEKWNDKISWPIVQTIALENMRPHS